jgi:hypothetical protein
LFPSYDLAVETAKEHARKKPGVIIQVLQTVTVFVSEVKEPETLHFEIPQ